MPHSGRQSAVLFHQCLDLRLIAGGEGIVKVSRPVFRIMEGGLQALLHIGIESPASLRVLQAVLQLRPLVGTREDSGMDSRRRNLAEPGSIESLRTLTHRRGRRRRIWVNTIEDLFSGEFPRQMRRNGVGLRAFLRCMCTDKKRRGDQEDGEDFFHEGVWEIQAKRK